MDIRPCFNIFKIIYIFKRHFLNFTVTKLEHLPNVVAAGFDGKINLLWRYFDTPPDANDWSCPERQVGE